MLIWVIIALVLAFLTVIEMMLGFTMPFPALSYPWNGIPDSHHGKRGGKRSYEKQDQGA